MSKSAAYAVRITSPFGAFDVFVDAHPDASTSDYKRDAVAAFCADSNMSGIYQSCHVKAQGEPKRARTVPAEATAARNAPWAKICKAA